MSVRWYQWPSIERQLVVFAKSFLGPYAFTVRLEDDRWICPGRHRAISASTRSS